jgi:nitroreductase
MEMKELVRRTRSCRRFKQDPISEGTLRELVGLARLSASGGNNQPLKYLLSADPATNARIFPATIWAAHLRPWPGPAEGERPTAYIVILLDKQISAGAGCDHGIAAQTIALGAMERGIGACMIGSIKRPELAQALQLPDRYEILLVVALGVPGEKIVIEDLAPGSGTKYYRDAADVHHVPKRRLADVIVRGG